MTDRHSNTAFTLVEILIVVMVLGILGTVVIPFVLDTADVQISAGSHQVVCDIQYAQNLAIVSQRPVTITFDVANESYVLANASGPLIHPITQKAYQVDFRESRRFDQVDLVAATFDGTPSLSFDELGAPDATGSVTLRSGQRTCDVAVQNVTGQVVVTDK